MARAGRLPPALIRVSASGTPRLALLAGCIATSLIIAAADSMKGPLYEILLDLYAPFVMIILLSFSLAVIRLRRTEPGLRLGHVLVGMVGRAHERTGGDVLEEGEVHDPMISRRIVNRLLELDKPIVCAINGVATACTLGGQGKRIEANGT